MGRPARNVSFIALVLALSPAIMWAQNATERVPACAACHTQGKTQPSTSMGRASESITASSSLLASQPVLTFRENRYSYRIERRGDQSIYTVSDGKQAVSIPIGWALGAGRMGQTYVLQRDGEFYESRVSYFTEIAGLDITIGQADSKPKNLSEALGRRMDASEVHRCFGCHSTGSHDGKQLTLDRLSPGVQCVHCHTAAPKHLAGLAEGELHLDEMKNLSGMSADQSLQFCGQCHRTLEEVLMMNRRDITSVRFQPYRLGLSKCYEPEDGRISCVACHDPHVELVSEQSHYDSRCMACHNGAKGGARSCKRAKKDCATCHMPKLEVPGTHHRFSDHRIRVVKPREPFAWIGLPVRKSKIPVAPWRDHSIGILWDHLQ